MTEEQQVQRMGRGIKDPRKRGDETGWSKVRGTHAKEREAEGDKDQCRSLWGWNFTLKAADHPCKATRRYASVYIL